MGMFDYFCIDNKWIPEGKQIPYDKQDYQTKDLECLLHAYEVHEDGRLFMIREGGFNTCILDGGEVFKPINYTGELDFYNLEDEYKAWFVDGVLTRIVKTGRY